MFVSDTKIIISLVVLILITITEQQKKDPEFLKTYASYREECSKQEGVDLDYAAKIWSSNKFPTNDAKLNCFYKCISLKLGTLTEDGEVVDDVLQTVAQQLSDDTGDEIRKECGDLEGEDLCVVGLKLVACIRAAELD